MTSFEPGKSDSPLSAQTIRTGSGFDLVVEKRREPDQIQLVLRAATPKKCVLHWGVRGTGESGWRSLSQAFWPEGTTAAGTAAMQTPFQHADGEKRISLSLKSESAPDLLEFALFFPDENSWDNNGRSNYQISLSNGQAGISPAEVLKNQAGNGDVLFERSFSVGDGRQLAVIVQQAQDQYRVRLAANLSGSLILHWGIARRSPQEWLVPPESWRPPGTILWGDQTAQTPFIFRDGLNQLELTFPNAEAPLGIQFVLKHGSDGPWLKHHHGNFYVALREASPASPQSLQEGLSQLGERIVQAEMGSGSWTLMHRFNLCFDLLVQAQANTDELALLFVWLRYSAIRQLTWQRNYNTKPRELAHAQDRLGDRLSELYRTAPPGRPFFRLMLATIGRGGDGQRIRDEILQIMHRHHLKEVSGHFLEEWHQKLHNNTTPDDIVICEAYLEFLRANGDLARFDQTLQKGGVTRERLETFERPIRTPPDFVAHLKEPLIHDFENFLKILNSVHSSTDLETAINGARARLNSDLQGLLGHVWNQRNDSGDGLVTLVQNITDARRRLSHLLDEQQQLRSLLYLDLALEQQLRVVVERNLHHHLTGEQLIQLVGLVLQNATLSQEEPELAACLRHWERLAKSPAEPPLSAGWSLHAKSVIDRIGRALADWTDRLYRTLQPKAEFLGQSFQAETWTITLFSEEVVRGSSLGFVLSALLHQMDRILRQAAKLGDWQIVSRGSGTGRVEVVQALKSVQGKQFSEPAVVIADKVNGDEELPEQVVAVLAPDVTDLVSHVAVRARNAGVLFASCSDPELFGRLKSRAGSLLRLEVTAAGDVAFKPVAQIEPTHPATPRGQRPVFARIPRFTKYAAALDEFNEQMVGAKSCSQKRLRGKLPDWVKQPPSLALPFGTFEQVLDSPANTSVARRYRELTKALNSASGSSTLVALRQAIEDLTAPDELKSALRATFDVVGIAWPHDWEAAWRCIKQVWASKWNERAVLSRARVGLDHDTLFMAVLVQPVVPAEYAFVIHTVNPSNGNRDELYAEVVLGLGETLVGNFPGRALSFAWNKRNHQARLVSFPSKSQALYGGGLIFRSDSNGEDLAGYAGAGLYDSILLNPPRAGLLDYSNEPLLWDSKFREGLFSSIARLGMAVEKSLGSAQDIEGAVARGEYFVVQSRPQVGLEPANK